MARSEEIARDQSLCFGNACEHLIRQTKELGEDKFQREITEIHRIELSSDDCLSLHTVIREVMDVSQVCQ